MNKIVILAAVCCCLLLSSSSAMAWYYKRYTLDSLRGTVQSGSNVEFTIYLNGDFDTPFYSKTLEAGKPHSFNLELPMAKGELTSVSFRRGNFGFVKQDLWAHNVQLLPLVPGKWFATVFAGVGPAGVIKPSLQLKDGAFNLPATPLTGSDLTRYNSVMNGSFAWGGRTYTIFVNPASE